MIKTKLLVFVSLFMFSGTVRAEEEPTFTHILAPVVIKNDEDGVRKLINDFVAAWNKHDPKEMVERWLPEGDLINPWGKLATGKEQVQQLFAEELKGPLKLVKMKQEINHIRFATLNTAFVDATAFLEGPLDKTTKKLIPAEQHVVYLAVKEKGIWYIAALRPYILLGPIEQIKEN